MYYEDLSYEDFLLSRLCKYRDELNLYFTSDTTDEEIANIVALIEEKEFPFNINSYRVNADYDNDILREKDLLELDKHIQLSKSNGVKCIF